MKTLFIDTNVLLSFYQYTSDDLDELGKLAVLLRERALGLVLPQQVVEEFARNRGGRVAESLKRLKGQRLNLEFPTLCRVYSEFEQLRVLQREYEGKHAALVAALQRDAEGRQLKADQVVDHLFAAASVSQRTPAILAAANERMAVGNPPGKSRSLGDAVNWETLLSEVPAGQDLIFVAADTDWTSAIDSSQFNEFLLTEWRERKKSSLRFYTQLSSFFRDDFPTIRLADELAKETLISQLAGSTSFGATHSVIAKLANYADFLPGQAQRLAEAALANHQIYWIIKDADVNGFFLNLASNCHQDIEENTLDRLCQML